MFKKLFIFIFFGILFIGCGSSNKKISYSEVFDDDYQKRKTSSMSIEDVKRRIEREKQQNRIKSQKACQLGMDFTTKDVQGIMGKPDANSADLIWTYGSINLYFLADRLISLENCDKLEQEIAQEEAIIRMKERELDLLSESVKITNEVRNKKENKKLVEWVQPTNKKEPCKVYVGFSDEKENPTLDKTYKLYWDGECKDGFAFGLGREIERGKFRNMSQLGFYEKGMTQKYCVQDFEETKEWSGECLYSDEKENYGLSQLVELRSDGIESLYYVLTKQVSKNNPVKLGKAVSPFFEGSEIFVKEFPNFMYRLTDNRDNPNQKYSFTFEIKNSEENKHGWSLAHSREDNASYLKEWNNDVGGVLIKNNIPDEFFDKANSIAQEINLVAQKAQVAYNKAQEIKNQYLNKICKDDFKVPFLKEADYKFICIKDRILEDLINKKLKSINETQK